MKAMKNKILSRQLRKRALCALFALATLAATAHAGLVSGQGRKASPQRRRTARPTLPVRSVPRAVVYESKAAGDPFRSGDVYMRATQNSHMTVPIGMSKGAPVLVEFPAEDPLYSFHEGNEKMARVNCGQAADGARNQCALRPTDPLVLQSGEEFNAPLKGKPATPSTVITVQRVSGMVISFVIYFVPDPSLNANRVVISYDLKEVLEARRRAGLMTQLVPASELAQAGVPLSSPLVTAPTTAPAPKEPEPSAQPSPTPSPARPGPQQQQKPPRPLVAEGATPQAAAPMPEDAVAEMAVTELQRVASQNPALNFSKPVHGLALAVLQQPPPVTGVTVQIIALKNTTAAPLRLLPDQPDLRIAQSAKRGEAVMDQTLPVKHVATTVGEDNVLRPNEVYYFAVAYEFPALGVRQSLYATFAHMLAADEPASAALTFQLASK